ncbi:hypothetical protein [Paraburkholderia sp. ZP32-5]|uniref:hypothetical protein n=1 Tax=Paraburkholderia sp. ZP32-5 TaxID=2883245 RepID=UPI001F35A596|nr:hypothetical protein [Paraburkholderia sp. ZP32-5]
MSAVKTVKARANEMIEKELQRCRKQMGEPAWEKHKQWVTENVVTAAKIWLKQQASEGNL